MDAGGAPPGGEWRGPGVSGVSPELGPCAVAGGNPRSDPEPGGSPLSETNDHSLHTQHDANVLSSSQTKGGLCYEESQRCVHVFYYCGIASFLVTPGPRAEFLQKFLEGKVMFGSWFDHIKDWLSYEHKDRIFYVSYEEMITDLKDAVRRVAKFLDISLGEEVLEQITNRCVFKNMKKNNMSNYSLVPKEFLNQEETGFLRKGIAGDWNNFMTVSEAEHFDAVYKEKMKDVDYKFIWD